MRICSMSRINTSMRNYPELVRVLQAFVCTQSGSTLLACYSTDGMIVSRMHKEAAIC